VWVGQQGTIYNFPIKILFKILKLIHGIWEILNRYGPDLSNSFAVINKGSYSFDQVQQMRDVLVAADLVGTQPVTFPIRAGLSTTEESRNNIIWLLDQVFSILTFGISILFFVQYQIS